MVKKEFKCQRCGTKFEIEVFEKGEAEARRQPTAPVRCPKCSSTFIEIVRVLSTRSRPGTSMTFRRPCSNSWAFPDPGSSTLVKTAYEAGPSRRCGDTRDVLSPTPSSAVTQSFMRRAEYRPVLKPVVSLKKLIGLMAHSQRAGNSSLRLTVFPGSGVPSEVTTAPMAQLPLALIPAYLVPLFLMLHLSAL
jgi:DNA-directed RNA polymerase subunit RPC12/RpoP